MSWVRWGLAALWVATIFQTLFVVVYATRPWRRHFVGRALFVKSLALMVTLQVTLANNYLIYPWQLQVSVILLWFVAAAIAFQFAALVAQWRIDRRARRQPAAL